MGIRGKGEGNLGYEGVVIAVIGQVRTDEDGETGFILEEISGESIARNITRALDNPELENIADNARSLVVREYTYEAAISRYREILSALDRR